MNPRMIILAMDIGLKTYIMRNIPNTQSNNANQRIILTDPHFRINQ